MRHLGLAALLVLLAWPVVAQAPVASPAPKSGGVLTLRLREDLPQGFALHESPTISSLWPAQPCFSNLVLFDPARPTHGPDTIVGELAQRWSWQDDYRALVLFLRHDVTWHDGRPFTAADVVYTLDLVREVREAGKLRMNPRRDLFANVASVEAVDAYTVMVRLKRPQPSLLMMLASGFMPIYAAHVPPAAYRTGCIGTGPFKLKEWKRNETVEYVKNPDYFVKGRPYLDGLRYLIIRERGTATAALQAGRVDVAFPGDTPKSIADQLKQTAPKILTTAVGTSVVDHLLFNASKPPFDNPRVREAVSRAIDRRAYIDAVYQGSATPGGPMAPRPYGEWSLLDRDLRALPGYGAPAEEKARARALLAGAGFSASSMRAELVTRNLPGFQEMAAFLAAELKRVGIDVTVRPIDSAQWEPIKVRGEFQLGADRTGMEPDDPDVTFYESYGCGSPRNYEHYCDPALTRLFDQQSQELDPVKRVAQVQAIQRKIGEVSLRPTLAWRLDYFARWPHVKNLTPHHSIYGWGRLQDVWLDR
jgi:peptide/nickel transport system substrate-binding protein